MKRQYTQATKSRYNQQAIKDLRTIYEDVKAVIISRLREFEETFSQKTDDEIFGELVFCILTPQSRAKSCWDAVLAMKDANLLLEGSDVRIKKKLRCVRFHNRKSQYILEARSLFTRNGRISIKPVLAGFSDVFACREWLVKQIKGLGYKEASHFLRNIGYGEKIAILDRHILRNLQILGVTEEIPASMGKAVYLEIEGKMAGFAEEVGIPVNHLDILLWYKETGEIFK